MTTHNCTAQQNPPRNGRKRRTTRQGGLLALALAAFLASRAPAQRVEVTLYNTGDLHEQTDNLPRIAAFVRQRKEENPNTLFFDCGDIINRGDLAYQITRGEAMIRTLAACGYDACIIGNHGLSFGTGRTVELMNRFDYPLVDANSMWPEGLRPVAAPPYRLFSLQGVVVAVIGGCSEHVNHHTDALLQRRRIPDVLRDLLPEVRRQADIVVLLTHVGTERDLAIASELAALFPGRPSVDVIFGAHDHLAYKEPRIHEESNIFIQHSGDHGRWLGEVVLTWDGKRVTTRRARLLPITNAMPEDEEVLALRTAYRQHSPMTQIALHVGDQVPPTLGADWLAERAAAALNCQVILLPDNVLHPPLQPGPVSLETLLRSLRRLEPICFAAPDPEGLDTWLQQRATEGYRVRRCAPSGAAGEPTTVAWYCTAADALTPPEVSAALGALPASNAQRQLGQSLWQLVNAVCQDARAAGSPPAALMGNSVENIPAKALPED